MNNEQLTYRTERLQAANIADLAKLHHAVYGERLPTAYFKKKYDTAYTGANHVGFIAYNLTGVPIGFYGVIPCFLTYGTGTILAAQSADTMTHPNYRNKGLFVQLALLTYNLCKASGIRLLFGFPNQNSLPGFVNKLDWQLTDEMDCFIIPANKFNWEKYIKKIKILKRFYNLYISYVLEKQSITKLGIPNQFADEGFDGVYRTEEYFQEKTCHKTFVLQLQKVRVWVKVHNGLVIGDMELNGTDLDHLLPVIIKLARQLGLSQVMFQSSRATALHKAFNERYHAIPSFPVIFKDLEGDINLSTFKFTIADIDIF